MRARKEMAELGDFFALREQARIDKEIQEDRRAAELAERRRQQREAELAAQERQQFTAKWLAYAVNQKPWDGPQDYALLIGPEGLATLAKTQPDRDDGTVRLRVDAAIAKALAPWREAEEKREATRRAVDRALSGLPLQMKWDKT